MFIEFACGQMEEGNNRVLTFAKAKRRKSGPNSLAGHTQSNEIQN